MNRRVFVLAGTGIAAGGTALASLFGRGIDRADAAAPAESFPVTKTDAEWKAQLSPEAYSVLRHEGTERAFTSPLNEEHRKGMFHCAGCDQAVYSSDKKFDSGTGWPSFWQEEANAVGKKEDRSFLMVRTECHCSNCGGHLGHIFDDGPKPTGLRHCINGVAMTFKPAVGAS